MKKNILIVEMGKPSPSGGYGGSFISAIQLINRLDERFNIFFYLEYNIIDVVKKIKNKNIVIITNNDIIYSDSNFVDYKNYLPKFIKKSFFYKFFSFTKQKNNISRFVKIIKSNHINIVHGNNKFSANISCLIAAKLTNTPYIQHQRTFQYSTEIFTQRYLSYPEKYIAISNSVKSNLNKDLKISNQNILLVHNWININENSIIKSNSNKENKFNILWIGRLVEWKGFELMITLARKLIKTDFGPFQIFVFGDFIDLNYKQKIMSLIKEYQLSKYFYFHGFKDHSFVYKYKYDLYLHTSKDAEPFGRTIIETMMQNIIVLATNMGGVNDIIKNNYNGFTYDYKNINELIDLIYYVKKNPKIVNQIVKNAKKSIIEQFSGDLQIKQIINLYHKIFLIGKS